MTAPVTPLLLLLLLLPPSPGGGGDEEARRWGHSRHGSAFDEGPRQKPWRMEGIGSTHFPVTSSNAEVQEWFDQGNTLLHGFWWFEAERSFRWCLKLDPECAMAYWGLARAALGEDDEERARSFLAEASRRKDRVTPRERAFIELYEAKLAVARADEDEEDEAREEWMRRFDRLLMDHPDDVEAQALYWLESPGEGNRYGMEAVFRDVLAKNPEHVGILHYRIHNWDGKEGSYAIDSCRELSAVAPACGHLQHMPGHVLSGVGLWHEAAIAMDSATRVEKDYMNRRMILPEQNWDYVHNLDYLGYLQEQLGLYEDALCSARQQLLAPPPTENTARDDYRRLPMFRVLLKFERWDEVLAGDLLDWDDEQPLHRVLKTYGEARAHLGKGDRERASEALEDLREEREAVEAEKLDEDDPAAWFLVRMKQDALLFEKELEALLALAQEKPLEGIRLLTEAAVEQDRRWWNDPPHVPRYLYNALGEAYLELGSPRLAAAAFEKTLETVFRDGFALSGLVQAYAALGETDRAAETLGTLKQVWSDADRPNRWLEAALATGVEAEPIPDPRLAERSYKRDVLDVLGPSLWIPPPAPELTARDAAGESVTLASFAGKNLLLLFYLGDECLHCMEQIQEASERAATFRGLDTEIVAVSKDSLEEIRSYADSGEFDLTLLSDPDFATARAYHSYDDFEDIELHSTVLVDRLRRVHWVQSGGDPFMDFDFLETEARRLAESPLFAPQPAAESP